MMVASVSLRKGNLRRFHNPLACRRSPLLDTYIKRVV
jgi:hypothetical protein